MKQERKIKNKPRKFKCEMCGGEFLSGWSKEEAIKERDEMWDNPSGEWVVVCDNCFKKHHPEKKLKLARECGYKK